MRVFWMLLMVSCSGAASRPDKSFPMITTAGLSPETSSGEVLETTFADEVSSSPPGMSSGPEAPEGMTSTSNSEDPIPSSSTEWGDSSSSEADPNSSSGSSSSSEGGSSEGGEQQPLAGLYQSCAKNVDCHEEAPYCLIVVDVDQIPIDGYCTKSCVGDEMCGQGICFDLSPKDKVCGIPCSRNCPGGMECFQFVGVGHYCI